MFALGTVDVMMAHILMSSPVDSSDIDCDTELSESASGTL